MKTLNNLSTIFLSVLVVLVTMAVSDTNTNQNEATAEEMSFTASGTIFGGHPDITWNSVPNANYYEVRRLPVSATGYSWDEFYVPAPGNRYIDEDVEVVEQTGGLCQIRYRVYAYNGSTLLDTSDPVDFITTPNFEVLQTGVCREP